MSVSSKSRPLRKNAEILDLYDDIFNFFQNLLPDVFAMDFPHFLVPMKLLTQFINENNRESPDLWTNMKTVTMLQQLQRDMYEQFKEYFGHDYIHEMQLKHQLDKLSDRLTVVYTKMMNEINQKAQSLHSDFSIKEVPMPVMDAILRDEYMKKDHSGLRVLLTQLNTLAGGGGDPPPSRDSQERERHLEEIERARRRLAQLLKTKHKNRTRNTKKSDRTDRHARPDPDYTFGYDDEWDASYPEPDDDIRGYDDPDDVHVDYEKTAKLTVHELELMKPSLNHAIEMLHEYDFSMFPNIQHLYLTDRALACTMASMFREKCQLTLMDLSKNDYIAARRHLAYVIDILPTDNTARRNSEHSSRPAGAPRRSH